jgi:uncharacterized protein (DUF58 family)
MNRRTTFLLLLIYVLVFTGLATLKGALLAASIPLVVYLAAGFTRARGKPHLAVTRTLSADRVVEGDSVDVCLQITNLGSPIEQLVVEDQLPDGLELVGGNPRRVAGLGDGENLRIEYSLRGVRGSYHLPGFHLTTRDHLGLLPVIEERALSSRLFVLPEAFKLPEIAIRPRNTRVFPGLIPARKAGPGVEFYGVREYRAGDPMRWINERISARHHQTLFVNEFEQERAVDVGLILDCRTGTNSFHGNTEMLEHGIQATATLAESFLSFGNRVGLLIYGGGRVWVQPGYGKLQREKILQALAAAVLYERIIDKDLAFLPTRLFPPRAQLVLISPLLMGDLPTLVSLRAHGYPLLVISPDALAFEQSLLGDDPLVEQAARIARLERDFILAQLRQTGARVIEWQVDQPFHLAARYALSQAALYGVRTGVQHA